MDLWLRGGRPLEAAERPSTVGKIRTDIDDNTAAVMELEFDCGAFVFGWVLIICWHT